MRFLSIINTRSRGELIIHAQLFTVQITSKPLFRENFDELWHRNQIIELPDRCAPTTNINALVRNVFLRRALQTASYLTLFPQGGETPLHWAARNGNVEVVKLYLDIEGIDAQHQNEV